MLERFKRTEEGSTAVADRPVAHGNGTDTAVAAPIDRERMHAVRARQREEFGGINWGAAFFGWLVAVGLGALLVGLLAAAGAAVGLTALSDDAAGDATEIGLGGAVALLVALAVAYFAGGYVAGRMSRFDGARQGLGTWLLGLVVTVVLAVVGRRARLRVQRARAARAAGRAGRRLRAGDRRGAGARDRGGRHADRRGGGRQVG